ncbi:hypothetical protein A7982_13187 [Minicystis rosea]|nr:hypothetical protein A7982_13187 [Minicystis rosea]
MRARAGSSRPARSLRLSGHSLCEEGRAGGARPLGHGTFLDVVRRIRAGAPVRATLRLHALSR